MGCRRLWRTFNISWISRRTGAEHQYGRSFAEGRRRIFATARSGAGFEPARSVKGRPPLNSYSPFCNKAEDLEEARRLYEQMKEQGLKPDPSCYQSLLDGYCKFGTPEEVLAVITDMKDSGIHPDGRAYSCLITSYAKANMLDEAFEIFKEIRRSNTRIESSLYSSMIWLYCQGERPKDAEAFLKIMQEDRKSSDAVSYNIILSAYVKAGCYADAIRIFKEMKKPFSQSTYALMLNVYLKAGHFEAFNKLFKQMQMSRIFGDAATLEAAVDFYADTNRLADAEWLYRNLTQNSVNLSLRAYNKLLELFMNAGNTSMVDKIHREMSRVMKPDATTKRWVMTAYLKAHSFDVAIELYEQIVKEGARPELDQKTFELLVRAYVKAEKFFEAMKLAMQMKKAGMSLDEGVYKAVVTGMVSVDKPA